MSWRFKSLWYIVFGLTIGFAALGWKIPAVLASEGTLELLTAPNAALKGEEYPQALIFALKGFESETEYEYTLRLRSGTRDYGSFWHPSNGRFSTSYESVGRTDSSGSISVASFFRAGSPPSADALFRIRIRKSGQTDAGTAFDVGVVRIMQDLSGVLEGTVFSDPACSQPLTGALLRARVTVDAADYYFTTVSEDNFMDEGNPPNSGFMRIKLPPSTVAEMSAFTLQAVSLTNCQTTRPPWRVEAGKTSTFNQVFVPQKPSLILSEFMPNPAPPLSDTYDEWFELYNSGNTLASTVGLLVRDQSGSTSTRALPAVNVPPGGFAVFKKREVAISQNNDQEGIELLFGSEVIDRSPVAENGQEGTSFTRSIEGEWAWTTTPTEGTVNVITTPIVAPTPALTAVKQDLRVTVLFGFDIIGAQTFVARDASGANYEVRLTGDQFDPQEGDVLLILRESYHETSAGKITIDNPELIVKAAKTERSPLKPFNSSAAPYELLTGDGKVAKDERGLTFENIPLQRESKFNLREGTEARFEGFLRPTKNALVFVLTAVEKKKDTLLPLKKGESKSIILLERGVAANFLSPTKIAAGITTSAPLPFGPRSPPTRLFPYLIFVILSCLGGYFIWRGRSV